MDYVEHLKRQIGFLKRSCDSYDCGYKDEAIRIAVVIRVLLHDTNSSTSLLMHLNQKGINVFTTSREPRGDLITYFSLGIHQIYLGRGGEYIPMLGDGPPGGEMILLNEWWNEIVYVIDGHRISRKNIVLGAANKDGGAHVDSSLTEEYETLAKNGAVGNLHYAKEGEIETVSFDNAHLVALRQMGYELLNSPDFVTIVNG